jgi:hypothetical protein
MHFLFPWLSSLASDHGEKEGALSVNLFVGIKKVGLSYKRAWETSCF